MAIRRSRRALLAVAALAAAEASAQTTPPTPEESAVANEPVSVERLAEMYEPRWVSVATSCCWA